jgi:hypothetical protein
MRHVLMMFTAAAILVLTSVSPAQEKSSLTPTPRTITFAQLKSVDKLDGQLVQLTALVRHTDTAQVFTFGDKEGPEIHAIIPNPATDAANVGDTVGLTGFVRRFNAADFERDYRWFRRTDYPDVHGGDWVIVATSVRTPEGTELVPPMTISTIPPNAPPTKPPSKGDSK